MFLGRAIERALRFELVNGYSLFALISGPLSGCAARTLILVNGYLQFMLTHHRHGHHRPSHHDWSHHGWGRHVADGQADVNAMGRATDFGT